MSAWPSTNAPGWVTLYGNGGFPQFIFYLSSIAGGDSAGVVISCSAGSAASLLTKIASGIDFDERRVA